METSPRPTTWRQVNTEADLQEYARLLAADVNAGLKTGTVACRLYELAKERIA